VIVLDTDVVSAMMLDPPDPTLLRLLDSRVPESIWTTSVTLFEIQVGIERLPPSRKRSQLEDSFARALERALQDRFLAFDESAARAAAKLSAERQRRGAPVEIRDTMIAGIVISRRAELATRNVRHFRDLGLPVIDPWAA
jgi:hypothetical protein